LIFEESHDRSDPYRLSRFDSHKTLLQDCYVEFREGLRQLFGDADVAAGTSDMDHVPGPRRLQQVFDGV